MLDNPIQPRRLPADQVLEYFLHDLTEIVEFAKYSEHWYREELTRYEKHLKTDDDAEAARYGYRRDRFATLDMGIPQMGRQSAIVYLYSCFESALIRFCEAVQEDFALTVFIGDIDRKHTGIKRARRYLTQATAIAIPKTWDQLQDIRNLRNSLAHATGRLKADEESEVRKIVLRMPGLKIAEHADHYVELDETCIRHCSNLIWDFCNDLIKGYFDARELP